MTSTPRPVDGDDSRSESPCQSMASSDIAMMSDSSEEAEAKKKGNTFHIDKMLAEAIDERDALQASRRVLNQKINKSNSKVKRLSAVKADSAKRDRRRLRRKQADPARVHAMAVLADDSSEDVAAPGELKAAVAMVEDFLGDAHEVPTAVLELNSRCREYRRARRLLDEGLQKKGGKCLPTGIHVRPFVERMVVKLRAQS